MTQTKIAWIVPAVLLMLIASSAVFAANFAIEWYSINSGGAIGLSGSSYKLDGTIGQSVAGFAQGASYQLSLGFWVPTDGPLPTQVSHIKDAKNLADGEYIRIEGKIATTDNSDFAGFFYIEEPDRTSGMRVAVLSTSGDVLARGKTVTVTGTLATTPSGEREIADAVVIVSSAAADPCAPLGMVNKTLGGGNVGNPASGLGQYGVPGGNGPNNIGLLVTVWGAVTGSGTNYVTIDDGSGVTIRVDTSGAPSVPASGYVAVTGISSLYGSTGSGTRLLLAID